MQRNLFVLFLLAVILPASGFAASIISNGGFETGSLSPWTTSISNVVVSGSSTHTGSYDLELYPALTLKDAVSQTVTVIPGQTYHLTYYLLLEKESTYDLYTPQFEVKWNGTVITGSLVSTKTNFGYTVYSFDVVAPTGSTTATLTFSALSVVGDWRLDDVSLDQVAPEPSTMLLGGFALIGLGLLRRYSFKLK